MAATADLSLDTMTTDVQGYPVKASTTIYQHTFVGDDGSGYARGLVAGDPFRGVAVRQADNSSGAAAAIEVQVYTKRLVKLSISGLAITDVGKDVYASDDATATLTQGSNSYIGKVEKWLSSGVGLVRIQAVNGDVVNHQHTTGTDGGPLTSPYIITSIKDANGNELMKLTATASAINEVTLANAAIGNAPSLAATGDDTNIGLTLAGKGTGTVTVGQATGSVQLGTVGTDKIGFYGTTPAAQPAHVADPAATLQATTDNSGGTPGTTLAAITNAANAGSADVGPTANAIASLAARIGEAKADIEANNTAIDSILAQLATLGLQAAS